MKFLERDSAGAAAKYFNTSATALYLDRNSPRYVGGILVMLNARLFKFWHDLPEALRTGKPQNEIKHGQKGMFEELYEELPRLEQFMGAMTGLSRLNFEAFAAKFDFSKFKTLCDVGGATGDVRDVRTELAALRDRLDGLADQARADSETSLRLLGERIDAAGRDLTVTGTSGKRTHLATEAHTDASNSAGDGGNQELSSGRNMRLEQFTRYEGNGRAPAGTGTSWYVNAGDNFYFNGQFDSVAEGQESSAGFVEVIAGGEAEVAEQRDDARRGHGRLESRRRARRARSTSKK